MTRTQFLRRSIPIFATFAMLAALPSPGLAQAPRTPAQREAARVQILLASLKNPKLSAADREKIERQILSSGEEGARQLATHAAAETEARREAYVTKFNRAMGDVLAARLKAGGGVQKMEQEVTELRKQAVDTSRGGQLTKEAIKAKCDPAIQRLTELLAVSPEQAVEKQPELKAQREDVLANARTYHAAIDKLPEDKRKGIATLGSVEAIENDLAARERLAALLAVPMSKADRDILQANIAIAAKLDPEEAAAIAEVNRLRALLGIGVLAIEPKLCAASRSHSKDMVERDFFDHMSPIPGKETPGKRAALAGTSYSGENIYYGSTRGADAIKTWWYSPGHHSNMMGTSRRVGVGRHENRFTQMFGG